MVQTIFSYSRSGNRYKYQTKEADNYMDYNILDFGARHYDAATARWTVYDPASQYATPYISMGGNPVNGIDPTGTVSHRLSDSQASLAASNSYMDNINNGGQPMNYAMWSNVSSAGRGGGQTYYQIGLQEGGTANRRDIWRVDGKFYYNKEGAIKASNDIKNQNKPNQGLPPSNNGVKNGVPCIVAEPLIGSYTKPLDYVVDFVEEGNFDKGIWQLSFGGTLSVVAGASIEVGMAINPNQSLNPLNWSFNKYLSLNVNYGIDLSIGGKLTYNKPTEQVKNLRNSDLYGMGESTNLGIGLFDFSKGGNSFYDGFSPENFSKYHSSYDSYSFGISFGLPLGISESKGKTWINH